MTNSESVLRFVWTETLLLCEIHLEHPRGKLVLFVGVEPSGLWILDTSSNNILVGGLRSCVEVSTKFRESFHNIRRRFLLSPLIINDGFCPNFRLLENGISACCESVREISLTRCSS